MTITPVATTDVANYVSSPDGTKKTTDVVIAVNPDGTTIAGGGTGASASQVQGNVAGAAADSGNPVKVGGIYNTTLPTYTALSRTDAQADVNGNQRVSLVAATTSATDAATNTLAYVLAPSGQTAIVRPLGVGPFVYNGSTWDRLRGDVRGMYTSSYTPVHITTATTTVVKASAGVLDRVIVNTKGTVASTVTIYDNTAGSGTVIAIIDSLNLSGTFSFNVTMATGITVVTTGTIAPDITVTYR